MFDMFRYVDINYARVGLIFPYSTNVERVKSLHNLLHWHSLVIQLQNECDTCGDKCADIKFEGLAN